MPARTLKRIKQMYVDGYGYIDDTTNAAHTSDEKCIYIYTRIYFSEQNRAAHQQIQHNLSELTLSCY